MQPQDTLIALWVVWPLYFANGFAPLARGRRPLDFGKSLGRNRVFGDGKTFEGFGFALIAGLAVGGIQEILYPYLPSALSYLPKINPLIGFAMAFGAMTGDLAGAFIKRRMGMPRGQSAPLLDQLDFIIGGIAIGSPLIKISFGAFIILLFITPFVHYFFSWIGYRLGIKKEPW